MFDLNKCLVKLQLKIFLKKVNNKCFFKITVEVVAC